jgi:hypothetical protein
MAGKVHRHEGMGRGQVLAEGAEEPSGLRESVQDHQGRARTAHLCMEWHDG